MDWWTATARRAATLDRRLGIRPSQMNLTRFLFLAPSPNVSTAAPRAQPPSPPVFCSGRYPGLGQFLPKRLVRRTSFRVQAHSAKLIHRLDCAVKCFVPTPEDRLWDGCPPVFPLAP